MMNSQITSNKKMEKALDLEYLMRRYGDHVVRLAYTYLHDAEEARDVAQEVFLRVYKNMHNFQNKSMPYSWIYRVTVNLCRDRLRKKYRFRWLFIEDDMELASNFDTEGQVISEIEEKELFNAVMRLPVHFREVIILYYLYQFDTKKIAEVTGSNVALVKTRLYRGRQKLKKMLIQSGVVNDE